MKEELKTLNMEKGDLLYRDLIYKVQGCLFEIYKTLGPGFKEVVYQNAIVEEFIQQKIRFEKEKALKISYKGVNVGFYRADFIVEDKIILEVKAVPEMPKYFEVQLYYYLKATQYRLGLLVNFGSDGRIDIRRRIYDSIRRQRRG